MSIMRDFRVEAKLLQEAEKMYETEMYCIGDEYSVYGHCYYFFAPKVKLEEGYGYFMVVYNEDGGYWDHGETYELYYHHSPLMIDLENRLDQLGIDNNIRL